MRKNIQLRSDREQAFNGSVEWPPSFLRGIGARMEAELDQFLAHGEAGDAQPAGGFGLVAVGQFDGAA